MAKNVKTSKTKVKSNLKTASGSDAKSQSNSKSVAKKSAKTSKPVKAKAAAQPASKGTEKKSTKAGAAGALNWIKQKVFSKDQDAETTKAETSKSAKNTKSQTKKSDAKSKKNKRDEDLDDDLMISDDDVGGEEIPDLSDFEEDSEVEVEEEVIEQEITVEESITVTSSSGPSDTEAVLTDAEGRPYCKVRDCDQIAAVDGYCRYHYLLLWKKIQVRRKILVDGKLERYVEELTARYPDKFLEMLKKDLRTEKDFLSAIAELEIDESANDSDFEDDSQVLDEVRGFGSESSMSDDDDF